MAFPERWNFNPVAWMPHAIPDLEDWVQKLAATSSYDERKWRNLSRGKWDAKHHGIRDVFEMRPPPPGEKTESLTPKSGKDNKRKRDLKPKDPQDKGGPTRKPRRKLIHVDLDSTIQHLEDEENEGEELALVPRTRKPVEAAKSSEPETLPHDERTPKKDSGKAYESAKIEIIPPPSTSTPEGASAERSEANQRAPSEEFGDVTMGHSPSLPSYSEEVIKDARALGTPDSRKVLEEDLFRDCFTGNDDAVDLNDASTLFEEAINKFRSELSQCEAKLRKASGEEKALRLLCSQKEEELKDLRTELAKARKNEAELDQQLRGEVNRVKADCHQWKENMDRLAAAKEAILAQLASAETQLRGVKVKNLAQAKKIEELEASLAKAGAEVVEAKAEVEKTKATADKTIAVYLRDVEAELREASDREKRSNDLANCQDQRETLKEIHARGFDLTEEIVQAKVLETDARFLVSSDDEDSISGSEGGEEEDGVPEEEVPEDVTLEDATPEDVVPGDAAPKVD
ncbi:PREDICTED: calpastatin-like [Nicotiana attenuata]|uniref:calpastatin-like n=1 Tax=Nicotiana attenuata TaxID=49451 RepID=UPI000904D2AB|nr:PREDICTED: calpastatin-like [Nicotiana attenuata]